MAWQPTVSVGVLKRRAGILQQVRDFFASRDVMEVEVPLMSSYGITDPYNENMSVLHQNKIYYLQTSPEYHLKRLLCAGAGDIFSLAKSFRDEPSGNHHNPEFTMLEWYRLGWDHQTLIDEVLALIQCFLPQLPIQRFSYQSLFKHFCNIDPLNISQKELINYALKHALVDRDLEMDKDAWLSLIMTHQIEPKLQQTPNCCVIYDFPESQASLAIVEGDVARRFEIYLNGIELANGFQELQDPVIQLERFKQDNKMRQQRGQLEKVIDPYFMAALEHGLPTCSGVALGLDRLIMAVMGIEKIEQVLSFSINNA